MSHGKVTVTYAGNVVDARNADGKIWFSADGNAVLSREVSQTTAVGDQGAHNVQVTGSIYVVPRWSASLIDMAQSMDANVDPQRKHDIRNFAASGASALLLGVAQGNQQFAAAAALLPGIHVMCHVDPKSAQDVPIKNADGAIEADSTKTISIAEALRTFWEELKTGPGPAVEAARLAWQQPCREVLTRAAASLGFESITALVDRIPGVGWGLVPCTPGGNAPCSLARGKPGRHGKVAWFHLPLNEPSEKAGKALVDNILLATSSDNLAPSFAAVQVHATETGTIAIAAEAHRDVPSGVLSGYVLHSMRPRKGQSDQQAGQSFDKGTKDLGTTADTVEFVEHYSPPNGGVQGWSGAVSTKELPGRGLHRHVRVSVDVECYGRVCREGLGERGASSGNAQDEWCELLLSQHVPRGAYIDVDEVKARHDFDLISAYPSTRRMGIDTYGGAPIDVELPASVSGQHLVNFNVRLGMPKRDIDGDKQHAHIRVGLTLPVHLRYPETGCERIGQECEGYAWVEVPSPLVSVRCGDAEGGDGLFSPVYPSIPPTSVMLRVPRGIAWHRDLVAWGTVVAAAIGALYTLWSILSMGAVVDPSEKRHKKTA